MTDEVEVGQELIPLMFPDVIGFSIDILMTLLGHKIFATEQRKFNHRPENGQLPFFELNYTKKMKHKFFYQVIANFSKNMKHNGEI